MRETDRPAAGEVLLMVGTRKGLFLFWSDPARREWRRSLHHPGWVVLAANYDPRHGSIYAATTHPVYGALVQRSDDGGQTWEHFNQGLDFAEDEPRRVREVWQVVAGHAARPEEVWAGSRQAGLFRSRDRGVTWEPVDSLNQHPTAASWEPGGGGLILHTILVDPSNPERLFVAVSAGGAYRSDDAGASWKPVNRGVRADFLPDPYPEFGQCVHKMVQHPARPDVLFQQNHCGVYRSEDAGDTWVEISGGLPSGFGFPMAIHPRDPRTIFVVPLTSDEQRVVPDGQMALWRSRDEGESWVQLHQGLPTGAYLTILRDSLAVDECDPCGVYVGATSGHLFYSRDEGDSWETLAEYLPPIVSVSAARVAG